MNAFILFSIGLLISIIYSYFILPKNQSECPYIKPTIYPIMFEGMFIIPYSNDRAIHIHHWIVYLIVCLSSIFLPISNIIIGFSIGLIIQGLQYDDCFKIDCLNPYI